MTRRSLGSLVLLASTLLHCAHDEQSLGSEQTSTDKIVLGGSPGTDGPSDTDGTLSSGPTLLETTALHVVELTAGPTSTCARFSDGTVKCWGAYIFRPSQIRIEPLPVAMDPLHDVAQMGVSQMHMCARLNDGTVSCWGSANDVVGYLGSVTQAPTPVPDLSGVVQIETRGNANCALLRDGTVACWGHDLPGGLGASCPSNAVVCSPSLVPGLTGVTQLSRSCARLADGTVSCWGDNTYGQVGNGTPSSEVTTPTLVPGLTGVREVAAGSYHTCVRFSSGTVSCWGAETLSNGQLVVHLTPTPVAGLTGVVQIVADSSHTCARLQNGRVKCWGSNSAGQIGTSGIDTATPVEVDGLTDVVQLTAGMSHTCALRADASVLCWGMGWDAQSDNTQYSHVPAPVGLLERSGERYARDDVGGPAAREPRAAPFRFRPDRSPRAPAGRPPASILRRPSERGDPRREGTR